MPKVSVLVPVYNVEKYLNQCLDSLINQTLSDIEIICVNDGSKDSSLKILEEYSSKDSRIKIIDKKNTGYGNSMNIAIDSAKGEYIGIVESDDFAEKNMFEELYKIASKHPEINLIRSDWFYYTTADNRSRKAGKIRKEGTVNIKNNPNLLKLQAIWTCLFKKEFLQKNNIKFLETPGASYQDTSFSFKSAILAEHIYITKKAYIHYRQDNENSSVNSKSKVYFICNEYDEITNFLNKIPEVKKYVQTNKMINQYRAYKYNTLRIGSEYRDEFLQKFQETFKDFYSNKEIPQDFFKKINRAEFNLLLNNLNEYRQFIDKQEEQNNKNKNRKKLFSFRINNSRISIILFGKQILEIG